MTTTPSTFPDDWFVSFNVKIDNSTGDGQLLRMTENNDVILDVKKMTTALRVSHERNGERFELMTNSLDMNKDIHQIMIGKVLSPCVIKFHHRGARNEIL